MLVTDHRFQSDEGTFSGEVKNALLWRVMWTEGRSYKKLE